jgi:hypothetical protein
VGEPQKNAFEELKLAISTPPFLQVPDFGNEFVLLTDSSDVAISAVLNQRQGENLAPIAFASRLLNLAERKYSIYEIECLAVVWWCEKFRVYLEHKEFTLHTNNQALSWLLRHFKEVGRIARWILQLAPFKFKVVHISGKSNVVADCLTRQYEHSSDCSFSGLVLQHLPAAFQSIREHQAKDAQCLELYEKLKRGDPRRRNFRLQKGAIVYVSPWKKTKRYLVPGELRPMVLQYFHDAALSAHLGGAKTLCRIEKAFYWPGVRHDVLDYVRRCLECQKTKPTQNARVGLHSSQVVAKPMDRIFIDFVGPVVRSRRGNIALLVVLDGFSKFVTLYPVRK